MELYLVRHGQAAARDGEVSRALTEHGAEVVEQVAAFAARAGVKVDEVRHSGKLRAHQTAEILAKALAPPRGVNAVAGLDPEDDVQTIQSFCFIPHRSPASVARTVRGPWTGR